MILSENRYPLFGIMLKKTTNTGEVPRCSVTWWPLPDLNANTRYGDAGAGVVISTSRFSQNAPTRMAPMKANAMQTTSTFSFTARSADMGLLALFDPYNLIRRSSQTEAVNVLQCRRFPPGVKKCSPPSWQDPDISRRNLSAAGR